GFPFCFLSVHADLQQRSGGGRTTHDSNLCGGPGNNKAGIVSLAAHGIVAGTVRVTDNDRKLRHRRVRHSINHLGAILYDAALLGLAAYHKPTDILKEDDGYLTLVAV